MFLYKSDMCGLIIDVKWPLGALDKRQDCGFPDVWLRALSPMPASRVGFCPPPSCILTALPPSGVYLNLSQLNKA